MQILGIPIGKYKYSEFFKEITKLDKKSIIFTPNPEIILETQKDKEFKDLLFKADYLVPDGTGCFIAYQITDLKKKVKYFKKFFSIICLPYFFFNFFFRKKKIYKKYGDKICGSDLTLDLLKFADENSLEIAVVDLYSPIITQVDVRKNEIQKNFVKIINGFYKNIKINYYILKDNKKDEIIEKISKSDSKMLFSTIGMKKQEESVVEIMSKCKNLKLGLGVGSSFDYLTGFQKRAPIGWRNLGLEWLYRLLTGPRKMKRIKRLYNAIIVFMWKVIVEKN